MLIVKLIDKRVTCEEIREKKVDRRSEGLRWKGCEEERRERYSTAKTSLAGSFARRSAKPICRWQALA